MSKRPTDYYHIVMGYRMAEEEKAGEVYLGTSSPKPTLENIVTTERAAKWLGYDAWPEGSNTPLPPANPIARIAAAVLEQCGWKRRSQRVPGNGPVRSVWVSLYEMLKEEDERAKRAQKYHAKWLKENENEPWLKDYLAKKKLTVN